MNVLEKLIAKVPSYPALVHAGTYDPSNNLHKFAYLLHYRKSLCSLAECSELTLEKLVNAYLPDGKRGPVDIGPSVTVERLGEQINLSRFFAHVDSRMGAIAPDVISAACMLDIRIEVPHEFTSSTGMVVFKRKEGG